MSAAPFFIADWQVTPATNSLRRGEVVKQLEPKAMDVLLLLCQQQGELLTSDEIITQCWPNMALGDNPLHKVITQLRKAFDDKASDPQFIETIRKRGYRIIAPLQFPLDDTPPIQQSWQGGSPFVGLSAFAVEQNHLFFGRNKQIATLLSRLSTQINFGRAFCLLLGASGSGKSSLVNAGVLPRLMADTGYDGVQVRSYCQLDFADISQQRLFLDFASALLDWEINDQAVIHNHSAQSLSQLLQHQPSAVIDLCQKALSTVTDSPCKPYLFLFIDRLEVLLSSPLFSASERSQLLELIELFACSGSIIVFSACRNDFYPLVVNQPSLMAGKGNGAHFDLLPPNRNELKQMIRQPAAAAGLTWGLEPDTQTPLDELLCNDTANNPDALPMLQYTLQQLYLQRQDDELLYSEYHALGGIEGAIGQKAEQVFSQLPQDQQAQLSVILSKLITLNADGETLTSRAARTAELNGPAQHALVQAMIDSRLFVSHLKNEQACFSLAHEALLRHWQRAIDWVSEHQQSLAMKSRLQLATERWLSEQQHPDFLLAQGKPLQEAASIAASPMFSLSDAEKSLIKASNQKAKRKKRMLQISSVVFFFISVIAIAMGIRSYQAEQVAQQKRLEAESLLGFMVGEFADKLRSVERMDLLDGISNKALEYFINQAEESNSLFDFSNKTAQFKNRFQYAQTLEAMGEVAYSRGKTDEAFTAFENARIRLESLLQLEPNNLELLMLAGANAFWLGQIAYDQSDYRATEPLFKKYHSYSERMYQLAPHDFNTIMELSYSNNSLGSLYLEQFSYSAAQQSFTQSLALKNQALAIKPNNKDLLRDKADTISWLAKTAEKLGDLNAALNMLEDASSVISEMLIHYPQDASLFYTAANIHMQQSYLLSYYPNKQPAYEKAFKAQQAINKAKTQDPKNNKFQLTYYRSLAQQLLLSENPKIDKRTNEIIDYVKNNDFNHIEVIKIQLNLIHYFINRASIQKAQLLLEQLENNKNYKNQVLKQKEIGNNLVLGRVNLIKAKLFTNIETKQKLCNQAIIDITKNREENKSIILTYPLIQAYTCLNKEDEVKNERQELISLGINNFDL